ncbi:MAG: 4-alpha-glucanotransferase [Pirellulales bacterium]|nr:4-alpha-glucanotransferase [Pirellulales bacterium]
MAAPKHLAALKKLARAHGLQTSYEDVSGTRQNATPRAMLATLQGFGAPLETYEDVPEALRAFESAQNAAWVEPVAVVKMGAIDTVGLRLPESRATGRLEGELFLETGETFTFVNLVEDLHLAGHLEIAGERHVLLRCPLPGALELGYHKLILRLHGRQFEVLILAAPKQAYQGAAGANARQWGVFLPLYALHTSRSWGAGDLSDLHALSDWVADQGGHCVATLPILASFSDHDDGVSPYSPATRLFWEEMYLDVERAPELAASPEAASLVASPEFQQALAELRGAGWVDYRRQAGLKRQVLERMAAAFFAGHTERRAAFEKFVHRRPEVEDYARFRAACEKLGRPWLNWPSLARDGRLGDDCCERANEQYHLYVQFLADEELARLATDAERRGLIWYLDLPLGVNGDGYDVWRHRDVFARAAAGGAPPDAFFTRGQNWGFPPLHPERLRETHYAYWINVLRHHLQYTGLLRIDHVMGLHRLYWVPSGLDARDGVYVRYRDEELYAILKIESFRRRAWLVGENLGTVPRYVNRALKRDGIHGLYVLQFSLDPKGDDAIRPVPHGAVASINTHDLPMFAAFWRGLDIDDRLDLKLLSAEEAHVEHEERAEVRAALVKWLRGKQLLAADADDAGSVVAACLEWLVTSDARMLLVTIEDLWQELAPHNVPGTLHERRNWCRRAKYSLEQFAQLPEVIAAFQRIRAARRVPASSAT